MLGVLVNVGAIVAGSIVGLLLKKGIPEKVVNAVMTAVGLSVLYIGISGLSSGKDPLVTIIAMVLGTVAGTLLDIDGGIEKLSRKVEDMAGKKGGRGTVAQGFMTATLLYCIGAMAITGSIASGLTGDHSILFTKSLLDGISSIMLAASLGFGVALSALGVLVYQGAIALLAGVLQPVLAFSSGEIICTGSLMIIAIALNMLGLTKIKVANLLPGILFTPVAVWLMSLL